MTEKAYYTVDEYLNNLVNIEKFTHCKNISYVFLHNLYKSIISEHVRTMKNVNYVNEMCYKVVITTVKLVTLVKI